MNKKITIYYLADLNSAVYKATTTTIKTFKNWKEKRDKRTKNIAFILEGSHKNLNSYELEEYIQENGLIKLSKWDF